MYKGRGIISILFAASVSMILIAPGAGAEEDAKNGRLSDGRAFRTDSNGNQLVDYIAELELSVTTLKQQLREVESELEVKSASCSSTSQPSKADTSTRSVSAEPAAQCPEIKCPSTDCSSAIEDLKADYEEKISEANESRSRLAQSEKIRSADERAALVDQVSRLKVALASREELLSNYERKDATLSHSVSGLTGSLKEKETELNDLQAKVSETRLKNATLIQQIEAAKSENQNLNAQLEVINGEIQTTKNNISNLNSQREGLSIKRMAAVKALRDEESSGSITASARSKTGLEEVTEVTDPRASYSFAKNSALDEARSRQISELTRIQELVTKRDKMYRDYSTVSRPFEFVPSSARSFRGRTVSDLIESLKSASSFREISRLNDEIRGIKAKVEGDIGLMQRTWNRTQ